MKKSGLIAIILLLITGIFARAQNWVSFPLGQISYYKESAPDYNGMNLIRRIVCDSTQNTGGNTTRYYLNYNEDIISFEEPSPFHFDLYPCKKYHELKNGSPAEEMYIPYFDSYDVRNDSFFYTIGGHSVALQMTGTIAAFYSANDTLLINFVPGLRGISNILGVADSVKYFSFTLSYKSLVPKTQYTYTTTMILSKQFGWVQFSPFNRLMQKQPTVFKLISVEKDSQIFGWNHYQALTADSLLPYHQGNMYRWRKHDTYDDPGTGYDKWSYYNDSVKSTSLSGDTLKSFTTNNVKKYLIPPYTKMSQTLDGAMAYRFFGYPSALCLFNTFIDDNNRVSYIRAGQYYANGTDWTSRFQHIIPSVGVAYDHSHWHRNVMSGRNEIIDQTLIGYNINGKIWGSLNVSASEAIGKAEDAIQIYPNPASHEISFISKNLKFNAIMIYNLRGEVVFNGDFVTKLDISLLDAGMYFVQLSGNTSVTQIKLLKVNSQ